MGNETKQQVKKLGPHGTDRDSETIASVEVDVDFGGCPCCGRYTACTYLGGDQWFSCEDHKVKWCCDSTLPSFCRDEIPEDWSRRQRSFGRYTKVRPVYSLNELWEGTDYEEANLLALKLGGKLAWVHETATGRLISVESDLSTEETVLTVLLIDVE